VAQIYDKCMADLEQHLHAISPALAMNPLTQALRTLLEAVALARNSRDGIAALGLLQKVAHLILTGICQIAVSSKFVAPVYTSAQMEILFSGATADVMFLTSIFRNGAREAVTCMNVCVTELLSVLPGC